MAAAHKSSLHVTGSIYGAALQKHLPVNTEIKQRTRGNIGGKIPTGREAQPSRNATHQLFKCCSFGKEGRVSREELEEGPERHLQTCREDSPRDMKGCKKKYRDIYWEFGQIGRGDRLLMGQRLEP